MYHNTTHSAGAELKEYREKARSQEDAIHGFFLQVRRPMSPSQVWRELFNESCPLTSVRRAMTELTDSHDLEKTTVQVRGPFGRPEYLWRLPVTQLRLI